MPTLLIIGAGFSCPAGLPLGDELFQDILRLSRLRGHYKSIKEDIDAYCRFLDLTKGVKVSTQQIDFEEFISFLDIEHYLLLQGSDTLTEEGNWSQMVIRNLIALSLYQRQSLASNSDLDIYRELLSRLHPGDLIVSFNYDTLLEKVFEELSIPYRLVPDRLEEVTEYSGTLKYPEEEVILLKVHGSIDWFDRSEFDDRTAHYESMGIERPPRHPVFEDPSKCRPYPLVDGPYFVDSPLINIYRVENLDPYFANSPFALNAPVLVSPSATKMVYMNPLREFWNGFARVGQGFTNMAVIGFSMARHDEYIRQPIYHLIRNYQYENKTPLGSPKSKLVMVDDRPNEVSKSNYRDTYSFVNWEKSIEHFQGFDEQAIRKIYSTSTW